MIKKIISKSEIKRKIKEIAKEIESDFAGKEIIMVGILKGSFIFLSDLIREISLPVECDFVKVSSYKGKEKGKLKIEFLNSLSLKGKNVIIVEDIVDTGGTLNEIIKRIKKEKAAVVKTCALIVKKKKRKCKLKIDYSCFKIPDKFVVGYGLDFEEKYRNLDYIGYIK